MSGQPEISFVIPVYNKTDILPHVLAALAGQRLPFSAEYIFIDDASRDGSADVLQARADVLPGTIVIRNSDNAGPSRRLNQGAAQARGRYLCLIDADELIAPDAVATMLRLMQEHQADMVHGKVKHVAQAAAELHPPAIGASPAIEISDHPLTTILNGRGFVRMAWLVETTLFRAAGGCDERLFIQDESLPLRLALKARRLIDLQASVMWAPRAESHLSTDKRQQHHDRFFAYYNLLRDNDELAPQDRRKIAATCASIVWKATRRSGLRLGTASTFVSYLATKIGLEVSEHHLDRAAAAFRAMPGIRRP